MALTNMSSVLLATLLCSALFLTYVASDEEPGHMPPALGECFKELGVDMKDPKASGVTPGKVMSCVMQKSGVITPEGKISPDKAIEVVSKIMKDEVSRAKAVESIPKCAEEVNSSGKAPEEMAESFKKCLEDAGVQFPQHHHH